MGLATAVPGGYALTSGTSFAAPVLAGTLALALGDPTQAPLREAGAADRRHRHQHRISYNAGKFSDRSIKMPLGNGLVNAQAFLQSVR